MNGSYDDGVYEAPQYQAAPVIVVTHCDGKLGPLPNAYELMLQKVRQPNTPSVQFTLEGLIERLYRDGYQLKGQSSASSTIHNGIMPAFSMTTTYTFIDTARIVRR